MRSLSSDLPLGSCPAGPPFQLALLKKNPYLRRKQKQRCEGCLPLHSWVTDVGPLESWRSLRPHYTWSALTLPLAWSWGPSGVLRQESTVFGLPHTCSWTEPKDNKDLRYEDFFLLSFFSDKHAKNLHIQTNTGSPERVTLKSSPVNLKMLTFFKT